MRVHKPDVFGECRYERSPFFSNVRCSECGYEEDVSRFTYVARDDGRVKVIPLFRYCPGCGARVEGGGL